MTLLLHLVVSLSIFGPVFVSGNCFYCATPYLQNNWHLSGIPRSDPPKDIQFHADCISPKKESTTIKACTGACAEIIFTTERTVQVIRGCYADLMGSDLGLVTAPAADSCDYVPLAADAAAEDLEVAATRFCYTTGETSCNNLLTSTTGKDTMTLLKCNLATTMCVSCAKYDGKGKCTRSKEQKDQKVSVGNYCKKMEGKFGGHDYVERDAAIIAPFLGDNVCFDNTSFNVISMKFGGINSTVTRAKRDVIEQFKGSVCYCKTSMCNSSNELRATILPIVTSLIALLSALPLF
ncbi:unnamed protein product [Auanema sp. JU1783]|nr:unnamed protein product [Auanema sp. JU1783]